MFYDDFYFIDDYKPEFREVRAAEFSYCRPVPTNSFPYDKLLRVRFETYAVRARRRVRSITEAA